MKKQYIIFLILFASCSCEKQMIKLTHKCPELFTVKNITVPVYIPEYKTDTTFIFSHGVTDTLYITKDKLKAVFVRTVDTLKVYITVPADTIFIDVPVEVPKPVIVKQKGFFDKLQDAFTYIVLGMILLMIIKRLMIKKQNNNE